MRSQTQKRKRGSDGLSRQPSKDSQGFRIQLTTPSRYDYPIDDIEDPSSPPKQMTKTFSSKEVNDIIMKDKDQTIKTLRQQVIKLKEQRKTLKSNFLDEEMKMNIESGSKLEL